ncbi:hypothetical protein PV367_34075 [Streptomyces europaeiscabiei]|uniref:Uncharacterized protein n=1 Tax=Streptomyces europaeiscabiei TaxID=146819 RepID=A0AAJ2PX16_9ACTN|nr:hypothetical protein [Streptomyces europaeiscabiei]MDX3134702.1 hypothetical protein [Streptomyces europaeiscabiei]
MNSVGPEALQERIAALRRRAGSPGVDDQLTAGSEHSIGPGAPPFVPGVLVLALADQLLLSGTSTARPRRGYVLTCTDTASVTIAAGASVARFIEAILHATMVGTDRAVG